MTKLIVYFTLLFSINLMAQDTIYKPQHSLISLDKVKVVYRGIDNPKTVAVPNAKEYWVSGPGVSKLDEPGKYLIRPGSGTELKIVVKIIFEDNSFVYEEHVYQIKRIPILSSKLNGSNCNNCIVQLNRKDIGSAVISGEFDDVSLDWNVEILSFYLIISDKKVIQNDGNKFNKDSIQALKKAKNETDFIIANLKFTVSGFNGFICKINSISGKIVD
ncbi:GldM family protein [uncultured Flavobacterium sp.]|uniref:GldM family protein n=1 Tax=uncultured Flavobacterium sp. TaxID=165435 RepID=UPI0030C7FE6F